MKCSKCGQEGARYKQRKPDKVKGVKDDKKTYERTDFKVVCNKCGYEGGEFV